MKKQTLLLLTVFLISLNIYSQTSDIISFKDDLLLKANINTQSETFSVVDNNERFTIEALNSFRLELSANYKFLGLSVAFSPASKNADFTSEFLETQLQFFIKKHWIQRFEYSKVKGFYVENVRTTEIEKQYPNLKTTSYRGATSYVFDTDFSLKHLDYQNEWQRRSAGSFIPTLKYEYNRVSDNFKGNKITQNNFDFKIAPAYYYTWCLREHWFVSPNISPELGVRFSTDKTANSKDSNTSFIRALNLGIQFGYTNEKISTGARFSFQSNQIDNKATRNLTNDRNFASLYFGYRIDPPAFLERTVSNIERKLGL